MNRMPYRYDDIGNRLWSREFGTNCTYAANRLNQYTDVVRGGVSERSAFDLDGSQTNVVTATGERAVEYNGENRPVRWTRTTDGATVLMAYDRMGRRVMKDDETFVYDGYLNVGQTVWAPTELVATRPLVWESDETVSYLFHDIQNPTVSVQYKESIYRHALRDERCELQKANRTGELDGAMHEMRDDSFFRKAQGWGRRFL